MALVFDYSVIQDKIIIGEITGEQDGKKRS